MKPLEQEPESSYQRLRCAKRGNISRLRNPTENEGKDDVNLLDDKDDSQKDVPLLYAHVDLRARSLRLT